MSNLNKEYLPALTGLRAVAAYIVFFHHFPLGRKWVGVWGAAFFDHLYLGVSIFFVLSGFLIYTRYHQYANSEKKWIGKYLQNRFARIYPMYLLITVATFIVYRNTASELVIYNNNFLLTLLTNITMIRGFSKAILLTGVAQGWTLTVEFTFYALAPLIIIASKKIQLIWQVLLFYLMGIVLFVVFNKFHFYGFFSELKFISYGTFFGRCLDFYIGILLAIKYKNRKEQGREKSVYTYSGLFLTLVIVVLLTVVKGDEDFSIYNVYGLLINNLVLPLTIALFFWGILVEETLFRSLLEGKFFGLLGKSSYSFYLVHFGIVSNFLFEKVTHNYLYSFPILVLFAILLYKYVEEPLYNYCRAVSSGNKFLIK
jgi:peptidoglycan/LPS O-acetylase OafA/YrhL